MLTTVRSIIMATLMALTLVLGGATVASADHRETCVTIVDQEAVEATEDRWENLSWYVWTGGPRDEAPDRNDPAWHAVPAMPQGLPHDPVPGVYNVSHGESGQGSWFKYDGDFIPGTPGQEEVTHEECEPVDHDARFCPDDSDFPGAVLDEGEKVKDACFGGDGTPPKDPPRANPDDPGKLAHTGMDDWAAGAAAALLISGLGATWIARRRSA